MSHSICRQVNRVDSKLFLVGSQIGSLTPDPSFGHNLCFRYLNEQCEPILDIYVPRSFQWYKECHKPLSFDPWNRYLKFWESIGIPSRSQSGSCLRSVRVHSLTFSYILGSMWCDSWASSWLAPLQPLCLGREPKARVVTKQHYLGCKSINNKSFQFFFCKKIPHIPFFILATPLIFLVHVIILWREDCAPFKLTFFIEK